MKWILPLVAMLAATPALVCADHAAPAPSTWSGQQSGVSKASQLVVRSADEFSALWQRVHATAKPQPAVPAVDFEKSIVVAAFMGTRTTGGYSISIGHPTKHDGKLTVTVHQSLPGGGPQAQVITTPWAMRAIPVDNPQVDVSFKTKLSLPQRAPTRAPRQN